MTTITISRAVVEQAMEALEIARMNGKAGLYPAEIEEIADTITALRAALAQQAEPVLQTCNCRWDGEVQVQQCTLHEAHVDAIHEWAERAKVAERKLAQQAEPVEPVAWVRLEAWKSGKDWPDDCFTALPAEGLTPVYTAPPQRKPLTEEEIRLLARDTFLEAENIWNEDTREDLTEFTRAVERAHGIPKP